MKKRYRSPKVYPGEIKLQRGRIDGDVDMCIFFGSEIPRCDRALMLSYICSERITWDRKMQPSLIDELESRGYNLDTLRISISK